ncbi:MAG: EamA family transporter RarD [Anaerolineales bacterium]|uniref:EamA family transporter RarD n=1 Tax=Candidatus Villigracilis proximus TaxID=3140683 RepID=UPI003135FC6B|nr:EamA family transporter RarD [Anaerolineales bacterium]
MKKGILYGIGAYATWGFFPIYWKFLHHVPATQLIGHRIIWSCLLLLVVILFTKQWADFRGTLNAKVIRIYTVAAILIGINWIVYVWAVNNEKIVETSLGYFINPLLSVLLGVIFLKERLRPAQWIPIVIAALGVTYLAFVYGRLPYIALTLAFSFALYGLVKKLSPLGALYGLTIETGILFIPALGYLLFVESNSTAAFLHTGLTSDLLMIGAGVVTTIPLLMFASAARSIPLWIVGLLQYIAPTLQFLIGIFIYKEPFSVNQLIGFGIVWFALIIFLSENYFANRATVEPLPEMGEG